MTHEELLKKHEQQWTEFISAKKKSHDQLLENERELRDAFFDVGVEMPDNLKERIRLEYEAWRVQWDIGGVNEKQLREAQKKEMSDFLKIEKFKDHLRSLELKREHEKFDMGRSL